MCPWRLYTAIKLDTRFSMFRHGRWNENLWRYTAKSIQSLMVSTANLVYHDLFISTYKFGAKRPVMNHGYLEATDSPKFRLVRSSGIFAVNRLEKRTFMDAAGENQEVDVVILANGLQAQDLLVPVEVRGQQGRALHEEWQSRGDAEVYMESVHSFSGAGSSAIWYDACLAKCEHPGIV